MSHTQQDGISATSQQPSWPTSMAHGCRYRTPNMEDIDQVGIQPDTACSVGDAGRQQAAAGVPLNRKTAESVLSQLQEDSCVLTAEALLESQLAHT